MKERPILFSGEMVRAILDGRKTQTRRVIKLGFPSYAPPESFTDACLVRFDEAGVVFADKGSEWIPIRCPYGQAGDRLWVRETFVLESNRGIEDSDKYPPPFNGGRPVKFCEDFDYDEWWEQPHYAATDEKPELCNDEGKLIGWQPSIFMPRWASRITLEITDVQVERVQEITSESITAEGIPISNFVASNVLPEITEAMQREAFITLWNSINAKRGYSWDSNPWAWVLGVKWLHD